MAYHQASRNINSLKLKTVKIEVVKQYRNPEPSMKAFQMYEGKTVEKGGRLSLLVTEARKVVEELGISLTFKNLGSI